MTFQLNSSQWDFLNYDNQIKTWVSSVRQVGQTFFSCYSALYEKGDWLILTKNKNETEHQLEKLIFNHKFEWSESPTDYNFKKTKNNLYTSYKFPSGKRVNLSDFYKTEGAKISKIDINVCIDFLDEEDKFDFASFVPLLGPYKLIVLSKINEKLEEITDKQFRELIS